MAQSLQGGGRPSHHRAPAAGRHRVTKTHNTSPHTALGSPRDQRWHNHKLGRPDTPHRSRRTGRIRHQLAAQRPRAPRASRDPKSSVADTKGDRVGTYLVAKNTYFGRQNDSSRQRGPSTTRREGPQNLDPATCPQHYPMNTRPGALGGHLVDLGWGRGRVVAKVGARTPREREQARDSLNASPTRVGVPVRPSRRTGIWLRCA